MDNQSEYIDIIAALAEWDPWWYGLKELSIETGINTTALYIILSEMVGNGHVETVEAADRKEIGYFIRYE